MSDDDGEWDELDMPFRDRLILAALVLLSIAVWGVVIVGGYYLLKSGTT